MTFDTALVLFNNLDQCIPIHNIWLNYGLSKEKLGKNYLLLLL